MRRLSTAPTKLELSVLADVFGGKDPWARRPGTRVVSQALARLQRKGLIEGDHQNRSGRAFHGYIVTHAGMRIIESGLSDS